MATCNHRLFCHYFVGFIIFLMVGTVAENVPEKTSANYSVESSTAMLTSSFPPSQTTFKDITTTTTIPFIRPDTNATLEFWDENLNTTVHLNTYYSMPKLVRSVSKGIEMTPYGKFSVLVVDFHKETSNMSNLDSYDYATRRCDELYPGYVPGFPFNQYFLSIARKACIRVNSKDHLTNPNIDTIANVIFDYYTKYGLLISPIIMACFALMNIRLFLTKKSVQNEFVLLVFVQSWCYIFWSICYVLSIVIQDQGVFGLKLFDPHLKAGEPFISNPVFLTWAIIQMLSYPFSFMLEMTRFYKTLLKFSALAFPLWHDTNITKRKVSYLVLATLVIAWTFAIIIIL